MTEAKIRSRLRESLYPRRIMDQAVTLLSKMICKLLVCLFLPSLLNLTLVVRVSSTFGKLFKNIDCR